MRKEYDFTKGVRGKYASKLKAGSVVVQLEPEVASAFPDAKSVNNALRELIKIAIKAQKAQ